MTILNYYHDNYKEARDGKARQITGGSGQRLREMRLHIVHVSAQTHGSPRLGPEIYSNEISILHNVQGRI